MAKTDGQLLSPQAEEELLGDEEDPQRTDSTTGDQDPIYDMIESLSESLGAMADSLLAMNQSLKRLNSSDTHDQQNSKRRKNNSKDEMSASDGSGDEDNDSDTDIGAFVPPKPTNLPRIMTMMKFILSRRRWRWLPNLPSQGLMLKTHDYLQ